MDLNLNEDHRLIVDMVRDFAAKELTPTAAHRDQTGQFPHDLFRKMGELGLMGMTVPEQYGGSGAGALAYALAMMEIAYGDASAAVTMSVTNMLAEAIHLFGDEKQRRTFIPKVTGGDRPLGAFALTESGSGSDASSLKTRAVLDGDSYVINGSKVFITSGAHASVMVVMARTSDTPGPKGISAFLVERGTPGLIVGKEEKKLGLRGSNTAALSFEDCRVPVENRIGREGEGFVVAMTALDSGRVGVGCQAYGIGKAALDLSIAYAKERVQFGAPIASLQAIQWKLADMGTSLEAARLLALQAAYLKEKGLPYTKEASMAKVFCSEAANRVCREAIQIHGGYGYIKEYPVERLFRDCRVTTIYEGTSEVQRIVIARKICE